MSVALHRWAGHSEGHNLPHSHVHADLSVHEGTFGLSGVPFFRRANSSVIQAWICVLGWQVDRKKYERGQAGQEKNADQQRWLRQIRCSRNGSNIQRP
jgi:hypothetical protein